MANIPVAQFLLSHHVRIQAAGVLPLGKLHSRTVCVTPSPESSTMPVVRPEAYRDSTAWMATYMAGTLKVSNIICAGRIHDHTGFTDIPSGYYKPTLHTTPECPAKAAANAMRYKPVCILKPWLHEEVMVNNLPNSCHADPLLDLF